MSRGENTAIAGLTCRAMIKVAEEVVVRHWVSSCWQRLPCAKGEVCISFRCRDILNYKAFVSAAMCRHRGTAVHLIMQKHL